MNDPAIVFVSLKPREGATQSFLDVLAPMIEATRNEAGNEAYDLYGDDEGHFHLFERYIDENALRIHRGSDHFRDLQARLSDLLLGERTIQTLTELDVAR